MPHAQAQLFRLVYASRAVVPVLDQFEETLESILAVARPKNARLGVTGCLLATNGWFLQGLEGPRRNVSQLFGVIGRDLRHAQLELLGAGPAEERLFGGWSMCARKITPAAQPILKLFDLDARFDPCALAGEQAVRLLQTVARAPAEAMA